MKKMLVRALSLTAAGVMTAGIVGVVGTANASVTNCPSFSGKADLKPWVSYMRITPFEQHTFINAELASSTATTCTYNGTLRQEAQGANPIELATTQLFKKTELDPDGRVLKPTFIG
jgi:hypothetical protein